MRGEQNFTKFTLLQTLDELLQLQLFRQGIAQLVPALPLDRLLVAADGSARKALAVVPVAEVEPSSGT